jgi:hypothetical protein
MFEISPLLLALASSFGGTTLLVWHHHGGPGWVFALGGFLFILGRLMIAAICAFVVLHFVTSYDDVDGNGLLLGGPIAGAFLGIGGWSIFVVARAVYRDAFGAAQAEAARPQRRAGADV